MIRKFTNWLYIMIIAAATGCVEVIEFPVKDDTSQIVIYGQITDTAEEHYLYVSRTETHNRTPVGITGASAELVDSYGNRISYIERAPGIYVIPEGFVGMPGVAYHVEINIDEQKYKSEPETIPSHIGQDVPYYEVSEEPLESLKHAYLTYRLYVFANTTLPQTQDSYFLRWDVEEYYYWELTNFPDIFNAPAPDCYIRDKVDRQNIVLLEGSVTNASQVNQMLAMREIDVSFKNRHYMIVRQLSTTRESFQYWTRVSAMTKNTGSIFDTPPAMIRGNISNTSNPNEEVLGYFEATRVSISRFFTVGGYFAPLPKWCEFDPVVPGWDPSNYPDECVDCAQWETPRPPWF